ncbi:MAG: hypothetical protein KZQ82_18600 [Candidatus Thiodiazotropha sp. (ex Lucinoma annulata)]|nr:hypothetical protein [Candidatus Thiodiazotropha sp. (ex Lucinoma annulata)]
MKKLIKTAIFLMTFLTASLLFANTPPTEPALKRQMDNDTEVVQIQRQGLADTLHYMASNNDIFPASKQRKQRLVSRNQRHKIWSTWVSFLDRLLILDSISQSYGHAAQYSDERVRKAAFRIAYAAFLARYRYVLDFLQITEREPAFHTLLNEAIPELGLTQGTYADIKYRYLHVSIATQFAQLALNYRLYGEEPGLKLNQGINNDQAKIWQYGKGEGIAQTVKNGVQIIKDSSFKALFPIQKGVSEWMGDIKVRRPHQSLITAEQIASIRHRMEPGDVLLERREWYLSNIGLPGFWPHAALYIGTRLERQHYFQSSDIQAWVRLQGISDGNFESLLLKKYPDAYANSLSDQEEGHSTRVIEAVSEGVVFTSLEHSASADSMAVLRPKLSKLDKAKAILQAYHYIGRPYDFNFDFQTDSRLVCTELIYKAYESTDTKAGINLPVVDILGRLATPANLIVKQFDQHYETAERQFDLVLFLDGQEKSRIATEGNLASFRHSWKRPKWHVFTQGTVLGERQ